MSEETQWDVKRKWFIKAAIPMPDTVVWKKFNENGPWVKLDECPVALITYELCEVMEVRSSAVEFVRLNDHVYDTYVTPSYWTPDGGSFWCPDITRPIDAYHVNPSLIAFMPRGVDLG